MIGRLSGKLIIKAPPLLLIDVNGVGYEVLVPMSTLYQLPELGHSVTVLTHHYIREDASILYGFHEEKERALFRELIKISGVGPKMALTILSGMDVNTFLQCVEYRDIDVLVRLPGVGKKTAERLMVEMAGKLHNSGNSAKGTFETGDSLLKFSRRSDISPSPAEEAIGALIALGYKPLEASSAVARVMDTASETVTTDFSQNADSPKTADPSKTLHTLTPSTLLATHDIIRRALQGFAKA